MTLNVTFLVWMPFLLRKKSTVFLAFVSWIWFQIIVLFKIYRLGLEFKKTSHYNWQCGSTIFFFFVWSDVHCLFNEHYNAFCLFFSLKLQPEPRLEQKLHSLEIEKEIRIFIHNFADIKFVYWWLKKGNKKQTRKKTLHLNKSHPWWNATPKYQF